MCEPWSIDIHVHVPVELAWCINKMRRLILLTSAPDSDRPYSDVRILFENNYPRKMLKGLNVTRKHTCTCNYYTDEHVHCTFIHVHTMYVHEHNVMYIMCTCMCTLHVYSTLYIHVPPCLTWLWPLPPFLEQIPFGLRLLASCMPYVQLKYRLMGTVNVQYNVDVYDYMYIVHMYIHCTCTYMYMCM